MDCSSANHHRGRVFDFTIRVSILNLTIRYGAAAGVGLLILLTPLQGYLWRLLSNIRKASATTSDARIKTTQEVLQGIRVIKFFTWEIPFLNKIGDIRKIEVAYILRRRYGARCIHV